MNVEQVAAHIEIRQVLYRYCRAVDRGDRDMLKSVYHPGATDDHGSWRGTGEAFADYIVESMDRQSIPSQHHITNVLIEIEGERAAVESYFLAMHPYQKEGDGGEALALVGGRYLDRFERREGVWRIVHRRVVLDWSRSEIPGESWEVQRLFDSGRRRSGDPSSELFVHG
jgi:hypothetical protein